MVARMVWFVVQLLLDCIQANKCSLLMKRMIFCSFYLTTNVLISLASELCPERKNVELMTNDTRCTRRRGEEFKFSVVTVVTGVVIMASRVGLGGSCDRSSLPPSVKPIRNQSRSR